MLTTLLDKVQGEEETSPKYVACFVMVARDFDGMDDLTMVLALQCSLKASVYMTSLIWHPMKTLSEAMV